jgi:hypothetical protein
MRLKIGFIRLRRTHQMPNRLEFRGCFRASDRYGTPYLIDVFQVMNEEPQASAGGSVFYQTADGHAVRRIRQGVYEIVQSQIALEWVDPERA